MVANDADCRLSDLCTLEGRCTAQRGECAATSEDDCGESRYCDLKGRCFLNRAAGRCQRENERYNNHMWRGGVAAASIGGAGVIAGIMTLLITDDAKQCGTTGDSANGYAMICDYSEEHIGRGVGTGLIVGAGLGLVASIPMIVIGRKKIAHDDDRNAASVTPDVRIGPTGGSLKWEF